MARRYVKKYFKPKNKFLTGHYITNPNDSFYYFFELKNGLYDLYCLDSKTNYKKYKRCSSNMSLDSVNDFIKFDSPSDRF